MKPLHSASITTMIKPALKMSPATYDALGYASHGESPLGDLREKTFKIA